MDRRTFLKSTGGVAAAAAAAAAGTAGPGHAHAGDHDGSTPGSEGRLLRLAMTWPDDGKGFGDSGRRLARRIEALTAGRFRIEILETAKTGIDAVNGGEADLYHASEHQHVGLHPAFAYFAGLPTEESLSAADLDSWLVAANGQALWDELAGRFGVKAFLAGHTGPTRLWSRAPLETLADVAGQNIQMMGLAASAVRGIGAEPVALPAGDLRSALATGAVRAAEHGGILAAMSAGLPEAAPRGYATPFNGRGTAMSLGVSKGLWESLTDADKAAFAAAAREELQTTMAEERGHREPVAIALAARFGAKPAQLGPELEDAMVRVGQAVVAHAAGHDALSGRINASYMAFVASDDRAIA